MPIVWARVIELSGTGLSPDDVVAVARDGAAVALDARGARARWRRAPPSSRGLADRAEPAYGVSTGFGSLANVDDPGRAARGAAARARALARRRHGPAGRARGRAGDDAAARAHARDGLLGRAPGGRRDDPRAAQRRASRRVVPEHGSLGASGDLAPLAHCALVLIGEGEVRRAATRPARRRSSRLEPLAGAKEGLALINGTDGMLGMLVLALARPRGGCCASPTSPRRCRSRRCSAPTARSPRTWSRCARSPARPRAPRTCARCWPARRSSPATATTTTACRTPTRCAARRRSTAPRATRSRTPSASPAPSCVSAIDNPMVLPDGRVESCGNFHGAPLGFALRLPRHRGRRGRRDRRAPHRPAARRRPLARPAAVPHRRRRASTRG